MIRQVSSLALLALVLAGCTGSNKASETTPTTKGKAPESGGELTKLDIKDTVMGKGTPVKSGDTAYVRYRGYFKNGEEFDGNMKGDKPPLDFVAGPTGQVIQGWQEGIIGMKPGGKRTLGVPWKMAYGEAGRDKIPPKTDLYFDLELLSAMSVEDQNTVKRHDLKVGTGPALKEGQKATVNVVGAKMDGSLVDKANNFTFKVGNSEVMPGVDVGVVGMKVGGKRELTIPPSAAFGPMGKPPAITGNDVLKYTITLVKIG